MLCYLKKAKEGVKKMSGAVRELEKRRGKDDREVCEKRERMMNELISLGEGRLLENMFQDQQFS